MAPPKSLAAPSKGARTALSIQQKAKIIEESKKPGFKRTVILNKLKIIKFDIRN
jgi:hypothetical protein